MVNVAAYKCSYKMEERLAAQDGVRLGNVGCSLCNI